MERIYICVGLSLDLNCPAAAEASQIKYPNYISSKYKTRWIATQVSLLTSGQVGLMKCVRFHVQ